MGHIEDLPAGGPGSTAQERDAARKTVCHYATDAVEAKTMLSMLGLLDEPGRDPGLCKVCGAELTASQSAPKRGLKGTCGQRCLRISRERAA